MSEKYLTNKTHGHLCMSNSNSTKANWDLWNISWKIELFADMMCTYFVFPIFKHLWPKSLRAVMMVPTFIWWIEKYISDGFRKILNSILYCTLHLPHHTYTHTHTHVYAREAHEDSVNWLYAYFAIHKICDIKERLQVHCDTANDFLNCVLSNV